MLRQCLSLSLSVVAAAGPVSEGAPWRPADPDVGQGWREGRAAD